jgi:hypothetical protein
MNAKKTTNKKTPKTDDKPKGGISISSGRDTNVKGDVIEGTKTVENNSPVQDMSKGQGKTPIHSNNQPVQSAWANGLFYLFIFVVVAGTVGLLAGRLNSTQLGLGILAGILAVPLIGAFQLRMDKRLSEKNFYELVKLTISQLPLIRGLVKGQK